MTRPEMPTVIAACALPLCLMFISVAACAESPADSEASSGDDPEVVEVLTRNEDASIRETKIWIAFVEGEAFIRTGSTRWYGNVERDPDVVLRIGGRELPMRAERVADEEVLAKVEARFREKYGFSDRLAGMIRFGGPHIMRLAPREP